ncbi:MAG TPA: cysteine desulfurase [Spirochaetaceae bacterium]|jgi:cysteine desulfurase|nr:cysteine desulfurase [Spirochaetaceae bacterium]
MDSCYLDWAASAPPYDDILRAHAELSLRLYANPSSSHGPGKAAYAELTQARGSLAGVLQSPPERLFFSSGGSEADAIVLLSTLFDKKRRGIVVSAIEHAAVYEQARLLEGFGLRVNYVKPDKDGIVQPEAVLAALEPDCGLVSIMTVNNETGAVQPVAAIARAVRDALPQRPPLIHSDAVQALGKIPCSMKALGIDAASFSAHKLGGPRGIGALYLKKDIPALARGGGQEGGIRAGTHNTAGAWAFSQAAVRAAADLDDNYKRARMLEKRLLEGIKSIPGALSLPLGRQAGDERFSPYILSVAFPGLGGETLARVLDDQGIAVSTGSACSHGSKERRILDAQGLAPELSFSYLRISTGRGSSVHDIDLFLERAAAAYARYKT